MAAIKSVEERKKEFFKASEKDMNKAIADSDKLYTGQANTTKELYEGQISDTKKAYEDDYRENAIQKLVNEREVAESMANMGLTDSGLNRTQQTAVQLSYANQKADIDKAKQNQINAFVREMTSKLADIEQNRLAANAGIKSSYEQNAWDKAEAAYKIDVDAETERYKAEQSQIAASNKAYYNYLNKQAERDAAKNVTYKYMGEGTNGGQLFLDSNGNKTEFAKGINPYTSDNNAKNGRASIYGFFSNGYQPKGIVDFGRDGIEIDYGTLEDTGDRTEGLAKQQKIWQTENHDTGLHYWIWSGAKNAYLEVKPKINKETKKEEYVTTGFAVYF